MKSSVHFTVIIWIYRTLNHWICEPRFQWSFVTKFNVQPTNLCVIKPFGVNSNIDPFEAHLPTFNSRFAFDSFHNQSVSIVKGMSSVANPDVIENFNGEVFESVKEFFGLFGEQVADDFKIGPIPFGKPIDKEARRNCRKLVCVFHIGSLYY